ncbi:MAG: alpha-isopropylmalate synthase regulatory domain-containing protein [Candidatus Binatia bacterium]
MSIRRREDYLKPFRILRCKIDDQVDFQAPESHRSTTEATVLIEIFGEQQLVAASGRGPVQAGDNAMRKIIEKHFPSAL